MAKFGGGGIPQCAILFQKLSNDPLQFGRRLRIALANRLRRLVQESVENNRRGRAVKRPRPRHHFVQNHTERPEIAACIHDLAASLFRRHVGNCAHGRPRLRKQRLRHRLRVRRTVLPGETEVEYLGVAALSYENVGWLDISMNDAFGVGSVQRVRHFHAQRQNGRDIQGLAADVLAQRFTVEQFHHQERMARRLAHVIDRTDIGMVESRSGARFALEAFPRSLRRKSLRQNFYGYVAMEPRVVGAIHLAHPTRANRRENLVGSQTSPGGERHRDGNNFTPNQRLRTV